jgi:outer membrane protein OmpA-like peptidoglycan-associated protein
MKKFLLLLLLLIPIALLGYYCSHKMKVATPIQNDINTRAQAALDEKNLGWATLAVDGRDITLTGSAPSQDAKNAADKAVRIKGYNHINNQLSLASNPSPQQDLDQNNHSQTNKNHTKPSKEQAANQPSKKIADKVSPIKQVTASKDCQRTFNRILKTPIHFKSSSDSVQKRSIAVLDKLTLAAKECAHFNLVVHGHSDSTGRASLNKKLSRSRAKAVTKYFIKQNIDAKRLTAQGHGSSKPVASNKTNTGRARNRRIEITIEDKQ